MATLDSIMGKCRVEQVFCRTALSPSLLPGIDYALNPYYGCQHACRYCYVPNVFNIDRQQWGKTVKPKINIPKILAQELKKKKKGIVGISTVTDPYQPLENHYFLTHYCLEQLLRYDFPINILTKSPLVLRDLGLIQQFSQVAVGMTIPTLHQEESNLLEPHAPPIQERLNTLKMLSKTGIYTYIFFGPIYPTLNEETLPGLIEIFLSTKIKEIIIDTLHLKPGIWPYLKEGLPEQEQKIFKERLFKSDYYNHLLARIEDICQGKVICRRAFGH